MKSEDIRKSFGLRLKTLRKQKRWTQKELASWLEIGVSQFNKYECGLHIPPIEKLIHLSGLLDTTVDYLVNGNNADIVALQNTRLLKRFQELENFDIEDQEAVIKVLDAMIMKHKMEGAMAPLDMD
jgi:transcriptional regulator with XRE-family HTH domain